MYGGDFGRYTGGLFSHGSLAWLLSVRLLTGKGQLLDLTDMAFSDLL